MKILHTSDWHLGQRFIQADRQAEQQKFLDELRHIIIQHSVDVLLIAGDVFDTSSPPNHALRQYYCFLSQLHHSPCPHVIIIGGNHDSPATLNAPKSVLARLNVHVVGCSQYDNHGQWQIDKEIIELKGVDGQLQAVVAAVPFLRDRDLKYSKSGETESQRQAAIRQGIQEHYQQLAERLSDYPSVPLIAMGHLFIASSLVESEKDIHLGNLGQVSVACLPPLFDYVALGHLHRNQKVDGQNHIRYCGAPLPLSFGEANQKKSVLLLEFMGKKLQSITPLPLQCYRPLLRFDGDIDCVQQQIAQTPPITSDLPAWAEVLLHCDTLSSQLKSQLDNLAKERNIEILKTQLQRSQNPSVRPMSATLAELSPMAVFEQRCQQAAKTEAEMIQLKQTFIELQTLVDEGAFSEEKIS